MIRTVLLFFEHLCIFRVIYSIFSLNKQIFQLFQSIRAILRLLNHAKRIKFQNSKILYLESLNYDK